MNERTTAITTRAMAYCQEMLSGPFADHAISPAIALLGDEQGEHEVYVLHDYWTEPDFGAGLRQAADVEVRLAVAAAEQNQRYGALIVHVVSDPALEMGAPVWRRPQDGPLLPEEQERLYGLAFDVDEGMDIVFAPFFRVAGELVVPAEDYYVIDLDQGTLEPYTPGFTLLRTLSAMAPTKEDV